MEVYMYELIQVTDTCYYIQSPVKIGLYKVPRDEIAQNNGARDKGVKADGGRTRGLMRMDARTERFWRRNPRTRNLRI